MPQPPHTVHLSTVQRRPVTVAIIAADPVAGQSAAALLNGRDEVRVLAAGAQSEAEVYLVFADRIAEPTFRLMERLAGDRAVGTVRFVVVGDGVREPAVVRAVSGGLVDVIPRGEADVERVVRSVVQPGNPALPPSDVSPAWMLGQLRMMQQDMLEPAQPSDDGLEPRELAVLRLLADGWGIPEVALSLAYSERTVRYIIHGVLTRLRLRNRTQAVAYAFRCGSL